MVVFERMRSEQDFLSPKSPFTFCADDLVVNCGREQGKVMIHEGVLYGKRECSVISFFSVSLFAFKDNNGGSGGRVSAARIGDFLFWF